jgi:hypothetical protein
VNDKIREKCGGDTNVTEVRTLLVLVLVLVLLL